MGYYRPERTDHPFARRNGACGHRKCSRPGFDIPLLIGGATTSEIHTAVKIEPHYTEYGHACERCITGCGVVSQLLSAERDHGFRESVGIEIRGGAAGEYAGRSEYSYITLHGCQEEPVENRPWTGLSSPPWPYLHGSVYFYDYPAGKKPIPYIDWTFFFHAWKFRGNPGHP